MKKLNENAARDNKIMTVMRTNEISHLIAKTDKGDLTVRLTKGGVGKDYRFVLDAVPFDDKTNRELMEIFDGVLFNTLD